MKNTDTHESCHCDEHTPARLLTCDECGVQAMITDCGCLPQPRPIAPLDHHTYCDECAEEAAA